MKVFRKLNHYFIADEGEEIPASDFIWFYGMISVVLIFTITFFVKTVSF